MADLGRVAIARQVLAELGVTVADLQIDEAPRVPTIDEYLARVAAAAGPGARRTYGSYWVRMAVAWGAAAWTRSRRPMSRHYNARSRPAR